MMARQVLSYQAPLYGRATAQILLLHDFVREPNNYIAILQAISQQARAQKEMARRTGLPQGHVSKYLSVLHDAGFVARRTPRRTWQVSTRWKIPYCWGSASGHPRLPGALCWWI
jgi:AAA+ ATPase superfamily predicted ATPase